MHPGTKIRGMILRFFQRSEFSFHLFNTVDLLDRSILNYQGNIIWKSLENCGKIVFLLLLSLSLTRIGLFELVTISRIEKVSNQVSSLASSTYTVFIWIDSETFNFMWMMCIRFLFLSPIFYQRFPLFILYFCYCCLICLHTMLRYYFFLSFSYMASPFISKLWDLWIEWWNHLFPLIRSISPPSISLFNSIYVISTVVYLFLSLRQSTHPIRNTTVEYTHTSNS